MILGLLVACAALVWPWGRRRPPASRRALRARVAARIVPGGPPSSPGSAGRLLVVPLVARLVEVARRRGAGSRAGRSGAGWVADFAEVVATALEAGLQLDAACDLAATTPTVAGAAPWLAERLAASRGRDAGVDEALRVAVLPGPGGAGRVRPADAEDLRVLLTSWRLSEALGTPTAAVTATAARSVRERRAARDRLGVATAGPRASMVLLSSLPLLGPVGATVLGVGPARLYGGVAGAAALAIGVALTLAGWWWARCLLRAAQRPTRTGSGPAGGTARGAARAARVRRWAR